MDTESSFFSNLELGETFHLVELNTGGIPIFYRSKNCENFRVYFLRMGEERVQGLDNIATFIKLLNGVLYKLDFRMKLKKAIGKYGQLDFLTRIEKGFTSAHADPRQYSSEIDLLTGLVFEVTKAEKRNS